MTIPPADRSLETDTVGEGGPLGALGARGYGRAEIKTGGLGICITEGWEEGWEED